MGNVKTLHKMIAGFLIFFVVTAGAVPAVISCGGKCCSDETVVYQDVCHEPMLSIAHTMPDMGITHITIPHSFFPVRYNPSGLPDCHEKNSYSCCELDMPFATTMVHEFVINTSQTDYYKSVVVLTSVSEFITDSDLFHIKRTSRLLPARAAPVQLYLLNLSILC